MPAAKASTSCSTPSRPPGSAGLPSATSKHDGTRVRLRLGHVPITVPAPVADLTLRLLDGKRGHAITGAGAASPWLFPGGQPGSGPFVAGPAPSGWFVG